MRAVMENGTHKCPDLVLLCLILMMIMTRVH
jgi:hypothetical protein